MRRLSSLSVTSVAALLFAVPIAAPAWAQSKPQPVAVTNFPATQNVNGAVSKGS